MSNSVRANRTSWIIALAAGAALAGCSNSGSSSTSGYSGVFVLSNLSVTDGQTWQVNRPIQFTFSQPIDFDTVNLNTIAIQEVGGDSVVGEFYSGGLDAQGRTRIVFFQPACPTENDFSDAGFRPGGTNYQINLPASGTGATTIRSHPDFGNQELVTGFTLTFKTPTTNILADLFLDTTPGPPTPLLSPASESPCRLLVGDPDSPTQVIPFVLDNATGTGNLEGGFQVPNNLRSALETQVTVVLEFNQPVSPTSVNIGPDRLILQYEETPGLGDWVFIPTLLDMVANCTETGSTVNMTPVGVLPQNRAMRVVVAAQFEDMVGDRNTLPLTTFGQMETKTVTDLAGNPAEGGDEYLESFAFDDNTFEDTTAALDSPRGTWGDPTLELNGLGATFTFDGTGGPGGEFDLVIAPNTTLVFNTTSTLFYGGPGGVPQYTQLAVNGRLDVRHLTIPASSMMRIEGPNPAMILASGDVNVEGTISLNGGNAVPVFTLNTPQQPEPGAAGQAGGGNGGTASYLTNQVTPRGGNGFGAFQAPNGGGVGGESGWNPNTSNNGQDRRCAGGGGGRLGHDMMVHEPTNGTNCPSERMYGLNAESGFVGADTAFSAQDPNHIPYGGPFGPQVFTELGGTDDDFFGTMRKNFDQASEVLVTGELSGPTSGAGGGAGGDATRASSYPPDELIAVDQDKGAGGGGGAGAMSIRALGDIVIGATGQITAIGGHGSGGENTSGVNRVGGGSGGGSGGHIVLETAQKIRIQTTGIETDDWRAINARGGQGGAGAANAGGADDNELVDPGEDAKHVGYPPGVGAQIDNPWEPTLHADCVAYNDLVLGTPPAVKYIVRGAGGDGGPGIIQMHVSNLDELAPGGSDVVYDGLSGDLFDACWPTPLGYDVNTREWVDQLMPTFGRFSKSQSNWVSIGAASVGPIPGGLTPLTYLFEGTDPATGLVETTGGVVNAQDPILSAAELLPEGDAGYPRFEAPNSVLFDPGTLDPADGIYARNPCLLRRFRLTVGAMDYSVETGELVEIAENEFALRVTVSESSIEPATGAVDLVPRYFTVTTSGVEDALPDSASVKLEFQATTADELGNPKPEDVYPSAAFWETDMDALTTQALTTDFRFLRYRVTFDINVGGAGELSFNTPLPVLDFLRLPFKF